MDHLPIAQGIHLEVPFVVQEYHVYDSLGFADFEGRLKSTPGDFYRKYSKLQSYLFFGLVIEVLRVPGVTVDARDFIVTKEDGNEILTTRRLPSYLWLWALRVRKQSKTSKEKDKEEIHAILEKAESTLRMSDLTDSLQTKTLPSDGQLDRKSLVTLGILILAETLTQCFEKNYDAVGPNWNIFWALEAVLVKNGWCPYEITLLTERSRIGNTGLYYVNTINRQQTREKHSLCLEKNCDAFRDETKYETKHEKEGCSCQHVAIEIDLKNMVSMGRFPIFTVTQLPGNQKCKINAEPFTTGYLWGKPRYVAISHVWSDGLGNPKCNSLPQCQLLRLQSLCNELYEANDDDNPIPFWIDTLGIPVALKYRKVALYQMVSTFKEADKVLVLDKGLLHISMQGELQEPMVHIATSLWSRRLWTFQESLLRKSLHSRFLDGMVHEEELVDAKRYFVAQKANTLATIEEDILEISRRGNGVLLIASDFTWMAEKPRFWDIGMNSVWEAFKDDFAVLNRYRFVIHRMKDYQRLSFLISSLYWRSTSKTEDEAICLAPLLGQDVKDVVIRNHENWVEEVLLRLPKVPVEVLFFEGPRVQEYGKQWIPLSFLKQRRRPVLSSEGTSTFCERGLHVRLPGCWLKFEGNPFSSRYITVDFEDGYMMTMSLRTSERRLKDFIKSIGEDIDSGKGDSDKGADSDKAAVSDRGSDIDNPYNLHFDSTFLFSKETALIFKMLPITFPSPESNRSSPSPPPLLSSPYPVSAIMVSLRTVEGEIFYVRFECNVSLTPSIHFREYGRRLGLTDTNPKVQARFIGDGQRWVVG